MNALSERTLISISFRNRIAVVINAPIDQVRSKTRQILRGKQARITDSIPIDPRR